MGLLPSVFKKEEKESSSVAPEPQVPDLQAHIHEENQLLKASLSYMKTELDKFKQLPLLVCDVRRVIQDKAIIRVPNGNTFYVTVSGKLDLHVGDTVLVEQKSLTIVSKLDEGISSYPLESFVILEKPQISWEDIGGLEEQVRELREVVELPLLKPELFLAIGIQPPKGVLLYGEPGTGKTLLAKAVARQADVTFIEIVASELVQKFIGEGAKLVRDIFQLARDRAPSIIFIDEIDALAAERVDVGTSGEREVQRTFMQMLTEMDGFSPLDNVKIIAATNRLDILDPAILRPGRFDRLIEIPLPSREARKHIFSIHSRPMKLDDVAFDILLDKTEDFTGSDLRAVCTEAGFFALRENRTSVTQRDFELAIDKVSSVYEDEDLPTGMFG